MIGELATAVEARANVVYLMMNDRGYGVIRNIQDAQYDGRRMYADILTPDFRAGLPVSRTAARAHRPHRGFRSSARPRHRRARSADDRDRHDRHRALRTEVCRAAGRRGGTTVVSAIDTAQIEAMKAVACKQISRHLAGAREIDEMGSAGRAFARSHRAGSVAAGWL